VRGARTHFRVGYDRREQRAAFRRAPDRQRPAVQFDQLARNRQPESGAAVSPGRSAVDLTKALEDKLPVFPRDLGAAISDLDDGLPVRSVVAQAAANAATRRGELECVREQVDQHALQLLGIDLREHRLVGADLERDAPLLRKALEIPRGRPR
jgi:hypothetical protein